MTSCADVRQLGVNYYDERVMCNVESSLVDEIWNPMCNHMYI